LRKIKITPWLLTVHLSLSINSSQISAGDDKLTIRLTDPQPGAMILTHMWCSALGHNLYNKQVSSPRAKKGDQRGHRPHLPHRGMMKNQKHSFATVYRIAQSLHKIIMRFDNTYKVICLYQSSCILQIVALTSAVLTVAPVKMALSVCALVAGLVHSATVVTQWLHTWARVHLSPAQFSQKCSHFELSISKLHFPLYSFGLVACHPSLNNHRAFVIQ